MARLTFPSRLELNRPEGTFNAAPLANVILTTFLYVSPVQTIPPWDQTGVPGLLGMLVGLTHFRSSLFSQRRSQGLPGVRFRALSRASSRAGPQVA